MAIYSSGLEDYTVQELRAMAQAQGLSMYSRANKDDLLAMLGRIGVGPTPSTLPPRATRIGTEAAAGMVETAPSAPSPVDPEWGSPAQLPPVPPPSYPVATPSDPLERQVEEPWTGMTQRSPTEGALGGVLSEFMEWGRTRGELQEIVRERMGGRTAATAQQIRTTLTEHFQEQYGERVEGQTAIHQVYSPEHLRVRERSAQLWDVQERGPMPRADPWGDQPGWKEAGEELGIEGPAWARGKSFMPMTALTQASHWLPTEEGGVTMPVKPSQVSKRGQILGALTTYDIFQREGLKGLTETTVSAPLRTGPASQVPERGTILRAVMPLAEILPSGQGLLQKGAIEQIGQRKPFALKLPEGFDPAMVPEAGAKWGAGEKIQMYAGAAPMNLLREGKWTEAELLDITRTKEGLAGVMERRIPTEEASPYIKMGGMKAMMPVGDVQSLLGPGYEGIEAVLPYKEGLGAAFQMMMARSPEQLQSMLKEQGYEGGMPETWQAAGKEFVGAFRQMLPDITENVPFDIRMAGDVPKRLEHFGALAKRYGGTLEQEEGGMYRFQAEIPSLTGQFFAQVGRMFPTKQPGYSLRELEAMKRETPDLYARVMEESAPTRERYQALINAAAASTGEFQAPAGAVTPTEEQLSMLVAGAEQQAMEVTGAKALADVPQGVLERQVMKGAAKMYGDRPLQMGKGQYMMAPGQAAGLFGGGGQGLGEAALSSYEWKYAQALLARGSGGTEAEIKERTQLALEAQSELAGGRPGEESAVLRRALGATMTRAVGGAITGDPTLGVGEVQMPVEQVMSLYGATSAREKREFEEGWLAGDIKPTVQYTAYPITGKEQFTTSAMVVHPEVAAQRGSLLSARTRMVVDQTKQQTVGGDFDGDIGNFLALGHLEATTEGLRIVGAEVPTATKEELLALGQQVTGWGAGELSAEIGKGPGTAEGLADILDVSRWPTYSAEELQEQIQITAGMKEKIGPVFNMFERVQRAAGEDPSRVAAQEMFNLMYQPAQRPQELPESLEELRGFMRFKPWTGGYAAGGGPRFAMGKGMAGLRHGVNRQVTRLVREGKLTPEQGASLIAPAGAGREQTTDILRQRAAGEGDPADLMGQLSRATGGPRGVMESPLSSVIATGAYARAKRVAVQDPEEMDEKQLKQQAQAQAWLSELTPEMTEKLETQERATEAWRQTISKTGGQLATRVRGAIEAGVGEGLVRPLGATATPEAAPAAPAPAAAPPSRVSTDAATLARWRASTVSFEQRTPTARHPDEPDFAAHYGISPEAAGVTGVRGPAVPPSAPPGPGGGGRRRPPPPPGGGMGGGAPPQQPGGQWQFVEEEGSPGRYQRQGGVEDIMARFMGVSARDFRDAVTLFNKNIGDWSQSVGDAAEATGEMDKGQRQATTMMLKWQRVMERGLRQGGWGEEMAGLEAQAGELVARPGGDYAYPGVRQLGRAGQIMEQAKYAEAMGRGGGPQQPEGPGRGGEWFGAGGMFAGADKFTRRITSGWELMRMKRLWSMTGGVAMGAIPAAAGQEMAAAGVAALGAPMGQYQPGAMGLQLATYQAGQARFQGQMGRAAFGAWGGLQQGVTGQGLARAAGIGLPALGAGLIGGSLAGLAGLSATGVGLPVALGALAFGGMAESRAAQEDPNRMAMALAQGPSAGLDYQLAVRREMGVRTSAATPAMPRGTETEALGQRLISGELAGLTGAERTAAVQKSTELYAPEWMAPEAAMQGAGAWMRYTPGDTDIKDIYEDPRFATMAMRGMKPEQYAATAQQWGMAPTDWQQIMDQQLAVTEPQAMEAEWLAGQWQGLTKFGMDPMEVRGMAFPGGQPQKVAGGWQVPEAELRPMEGYEKTAFAQWTGQAEQARIMGLAPEPPAIEGDIAAQWATQRPLMGAQMGLQQQLLGMGMGGQDIAGGFGQDIGAMGRFGRFLGGDQQMMNLVGLAGGTGQAQYGARQYDVAGEIEEPFTRMLDALSQVDPQSATALGDMFERLQPLIETGGLRMGTTMMTQGFAEGYQLPGGVGAGRFQQYAGVMEAGGQRALGMQQRGMQYGYQDWQFGQQQEQLQWSEVSQFGGSFQGFTTPGSFALQQQQTDLSRGWQQYTTDYNDQMRQLQYTQFMENWEVKAERMPQQYEWKREDLAFQGAQTSLQYAWGQEDIGESLRYATGRERRGLLQQQERQTITYAMGMGQLAEQGERLETQEGWAEEDLAREREHYEQRFALGDEYQSQYTAYWEQRYELEDEMQEIREFNARFQLEQDKEQLARSRELELSLRAIAEVQIAVTHSQEDAIALQKVFTDNMLSAFTSANIVVQQIQDSINGINVTQVTEYSAMLSGRTSMDIGH